MRQTDGGDEGEGRADQIVALGASAGGIDVLTTIVSSLPADFGAPVVIAQHLDPRRESHLGSIIESRTSLEVEVVEGSALLRPGRIYLLPPNRDPEIRDGTVIVHEHEGRRAAPSVDALFETASRAYGENTIAVILSGTGSDGTAGAREVKTAGGTVVIQNPDTAAYPGMPRAIPPNIVDIVADAEAIGPLLHELVSGVYAPARPDEERLLRTFLDQVREQSGIDFGSYKRATILRRLQRRMAATNTTTLREYVRHVQAHPDEYQRLTASFLIKVTEFFRDADLFTHLREKILPALIDDARERQNELRLWSAGCATGEEAYSLAILVAEALGEEVESFNVRIFATDVDADAIAFARRGVYPASTLRDVPPALAERYFTRTDDHYEVRKSIRALTVFGQHDLGQRAPFPRVDLALCRNVLIYFTGDLQKRALQLFAFSLRDGGYLVLGKAESTTPLGEYFVLEQPRLKVYRREGERVLIPPARIRDTTPLLPARRTPVRRSLWQEMPLRAAASPMRSSSLADRAEAILMRLPIGVVVVDRRYDIQTINAAARRLLGIHGPAINEDFVHQLPPTAVPNVRAAVDAAFRGDPATVVLEIGTGGVDGSDERSIEVTSYPLPNEGDPERDHALVLASDITGAVAARRQLEATLVAERGERDRLTDHARQLAASNAELVDANQDLTTSNAELRSANEELLVANEELQATNEELETLNEELQATVEELNTTNDDLQARSIELQESSLRLAREQVDAERQRELLAALVDALPDAVAAVRDGRLVAANRAYVEAVGAPDGPFFDEAGQPMPVDDGALAPTDGGASEVRVRAGRPDGPIFSARATRVETSDGPISILFLRPVGA